MLQKLPLPNIPSNGNAGKSCLYILSLCRIAAPPIFDFVKFNVVLQTDSFFLPLCGHFSRPLRSMICSVDFDVTDLNLSYKGVLLFAKNFRLRRCPFCASCLKVHKSHKPLCFAVLPRTEFHLADEEVS